MRSARVGLTVRRGPLPRLRGPWPGQGTRPAARTGARPGRPSGHARSGVCGHPAVARAGWAAGQGGCAGRRCDTGTVTRAPGRPGAVTGARRKAGRSSRGTVGSRRCQGRESAGDGGGDLLRAHAGIAPPAELEIAVLIDDDLGWLVAWRDGWWRSGPGRQQSRFSRVASPAALSAASRSRIQSARVLRHGRVLTIGSGPGPGRSRLVPPGGRHRPGALGPPRGSRERRGPRLAHHREHDGDRRVARPGGGPGRRSRGGGTAAGSLAGGLQVGGLADLGVEVAVVGLQQRGADALALPVGPDGQDRQVMVGEPGRVMLVQRGVERLEPVQVRAGRPGQPAA